MTYDVTGYYCDTRAVLIGLHANGLQMRIHGAIVEKKQYEEVFRNHITLVQNTGLPFHKYSCRSIAMHVPGASGNNVYSVRRQQLVILLLYDRQLTMQDTCVYGMVQPRQRVPRVDIHTRYGIYVHGKS